jgi:excisionase family DNA binding protein
VVIRSQPRCAEVSDPLTLSLKGAAAYLSVPPETFRSWVKAGIFRTIRVRRRTLVPKRQLDEYVERQLRGD